MHRWIAPSFCVGIVLSIGVAQRAAIAQSGCENACEPFCVENQLGCIRPPGLPMGTCDYCTVVTDCAPGGACVRNDAGLGICQNVQCGGDSDGGTRDAAVTDTSSRADAATRDATMADGPSDSGTLADTGEHPDVLPAFNPPNPPRNTVETKRGCACRAAIPAHRMPAARYLAVVWIAALLAVGIRRVSWRPRP